MQPIQIQILVSMSSIVKRRLENVLSNATERQVTNMSSVKSPQEVIAGGPPMQEID